MNKEYYGLVSGLHQLVAGKTPELSLLAFRDELSNQLEPADYYQVLLLFYPYDHQNLLQDLFKENPEPHSLGNLSEKERSDLLAKKLTDDLYFQSFLDKYDRLLEEPQENALEQALWEHYFSFCLEHGNEFLQQWIRLESTLRNLTALHLARKLSISVEDQLLTTGLFTPEETLRLNPSDLDKTHPWIKAYMEALNLDKPKERKKQLDQIRWDYLDESTFFHYFGVEKVLAYVIKLSDLETNWDAEAGKQAFESFNESIRRDLEKRLL
ncbi:DUF2764 family protein [bacterium SCSIO 12741]|nr:DUF2764 family protein [bacterium SCSIO 12741]